MSYIGENGLFTFRDGGFEVKDSELLTAKDATALGHRLAGFGHRFYAGCRSFENSRAMTALCHGITECGGEVCLCGNTDLPSFRYGIPLVSADCGIFADGTGNALRFTFYDRNGFVWNDRQLSELVNAPELHITEKQGKVSTLTTFADLYTGSIRDSLSLRGKIIAGVSCADRSVRALWEDIFTGDNDTLVFQISDDRQRVNAYSSDVGFISYEKLVMTYVSQLIKKGEEVWLPDSFHYAADFAFGSDKLRRFSAEGEVPAVAAKQRFLSDTLYMCARLAQRRGDFLDAVRELPSFATSKRDIALNVTDDIPCGKTILDNSGRITVTRSGRNRVSLAAQAFSVEAAAELCTEWAEKLRRLSNGC